MINKTHARTESSNREALGGLFTDQCLPAISSRCQRCGAENALVCTFKVLTFVGLAPFAYVSYLVPNEYLLCADHANRQCRRACIATTLKGYWGFPGFFLAPIYIVQNLWRLRQNRVLRRGTALLCFLLCILVPFAPAAALFYLIVVLPMNEPLEPR